MLVPRPGEATGLLVSSAGAYTHQAYAAFPRMETGRIAQGQACALAAYWALTDGVPVHQVDVRKVQISNLQLNGQSIVYFDDTIPGTYWHLVDQMLGARRVPERNEQGVYQRESQVTAAEARAYLQRLFRDYAATPVPPGQLAAALAAVGEASEQPLPRGRLIEALSQAAGIMPLPPSGPLFADVPCGSPLAGLLAAWAKRGWIAANPAHRFAPGQPVPFSEFKRHAYHMLFAEVAPGTVRPVDYRPRLAHDTFNRPDGPLRRLESGQPVGGTGTWRVEQGVLRGKPGGTTYLLVDVGRPDVDLSVDLFLEQSAAPAAAGLVLRAEDDRNLQRLYLDTDGPAVRVRIDTLVQGRQTAEWIQRIATHRRGFSLRVLAKGEQLTCFLDGKQVYQDRRPEFAGATKVGLVNGGGQPSRLDNFEVRTAE